MKNKIYMVLTYVFAVLCVCLIGFGVWYYTTFFERTNKEVAELNEYYEEVYNNLLKDYNELNQSKADLDSEYAGLKKDYETVSSNLEKAEKVINDYNAEIEARRVAEEERWNSLSEEEQNAELKLKAYNEMVKTLVATNEEYAEIRVGLINLLDKEKMTTAEKKEYVKKYERRLAIEEEYRNSLENNE